MNGAGLENISVKSVGAVPEAFLGKYCRGRGRKTCPHRKTCRGGKTCPYRNIAVMAKLPGGTLALSQTALAGYGASDMDCLQIHLAEGIYFSSQYLQRYTSFLGSAR